MDERDAIIKEAQRVARIFHFSLEGHGETTALTVLLAQMMFLQATMLTLKREMVKAKQTPPADFLALQQMLTSVSANLITGATVNAATAVNATTTVQ